MSRAEKDAVAAALAAFASGRLVAIPTETVYGLAAPADNPDLVKRVFELKERPFFNPLIVHLAGRDQVPKYARSWPDAAEKLAAAFWPGPLTLILPRKPSLNPMITAGLDSVGLRCPDHPLSLALIRQLGSGLAAPSANRFTRTSPTTADHVRAAFSREDVEILDGGPARVGIESTVVAVGKKELRLLRPGAVTRTDLEQTSGLPCRTASAAKSPQQIESPGQLTVHYRPDMPLIVSQIPAAEIDWQKLESGCGFGRRDFEIRRLNPAPVLAAREVYACLRQPLAPGCSALLLLIPAETRGWEAIHDRLGKAASLWLGTDA